MIRSRGTADRRRAGRGGIARCGFTLVEMLVVIGVIGAIVGLLMPALRSMRSESRSTVCLSNLRQLHSAVEIARQQNRDLLPFAAPLPLPPGQTAIFQSPQQRLDKIIPANSEAWRCPSDFADEDGSVLPSSYSYVPGAFMLFEYSLLGAPGPPTPAIQLQIAQRVTQLYLNGYLSSLPLWGDADDFHDYGERNPRNAVFMDGNARPVNPHDGNVLNSD